MAKRKLFPGRKALAARKRRLASRLNELSKQELVGIIVEYDRRIELLSEGVGDYQEAIKKLQSELFYYQKKDGMFDIAKGC